LGMISLLIT
jgi:hypothetical protein